MAKSVRMSDIAQRLGVSTVTVSKALAGKDGVSEELRAAIQQIAEQMGYQKKNSRKDGYTVGILTSHRYIEKGHSFYWTMYERLLSHLSCSGNIGILEIIKEREEECLNVPNLIQDERVDGIIVMGKFTSDYQQMLAASGLPFVMLDSYNVNSPWDCVISDGYYGMYLMVHHLLEMGHREIAFVGTIGATASITDRYYGYCRAMQEAGLRVTEEMVIPDRDINGKVAVSLSSIRCMPTAFACNCDDVAYVLMNKLKEGGVRIPEDVSIVGFDNFILSELAVPQITTYAVNVDEMAQQSIQQLKRRIECADIAPGRIIVSGKPILRGSVRRMKGESV